MKAQLIEFTQIIATHCAHAYYKLYNFYRNVTR